MINLFNVLQTKLMQIVKRSNTISGKQREQAVNLS